MVTGWFEQNNLLIDGYVSYMESIPRDILRNNGVYDKLSILLYSRLYTIGWYQG